jgi:hypothetical protein
MVNRPSSILQTKTSRPQMGREGESRGTTQVSHQKVGRFALTNISLSYNVEITVRTTIGHNNVVSLLSHERLERELRLVSDECNFITCFAHLWQLPPVYFPLSLPIVIFWSLPACWRFSGASSLIPNGFACYALLSAKTGRCQGWDSAWIGEAGRGQERSERQFNTSIFGSNGIRSIKSMKSASVASD